MGRARVGIARYRRPMPRATARPKPADDSDDAPLRRLGGGRWQTRDERFTIEPQSGTWVVVDAEQTDDFGMALIRGPYPSLTDAKQGIVTARKSAPAESPLAGRIERGGRDRPPAAVDPLAEAQAPTTTSTNTARSPKRTSPVAATPHATPPTRSRTKPNPPHAIASSEPTWLTDLQPALRGKARRLIARLDGAGVADAVSVARRDILGDVPSVAAIAIARRLADLGGDTPPAAVADLLADGHDDVLGVRWRLVDGAGRPITLDRRR